eukprot:Seg1009.3 transcript_id=Seg1009.3/GoldUCD/mRNA.D3Y31 product="Short coiled-coil protein A" protein_id=Seg1009.3/GoldUCD/D3Y31
MDENAMEDVPLGKNEGSDARKVLNESFRDKPQKGELHRQSPVSDGEIAIKGDNKDEKNKGFHSESIDIQENVAAEEEKIRLINQVLALQSTLDDLSQRVDAVKDENLKLKSENQVLGQYIENLMAASNVFQATGETKGRKASVRPSKKR